MSIPRGFKGVWIPREIWLSKELSLQEKVMIVEIDSLTKNDKGYCYASNKHFAEFFGLSNSRVSRIISSLLKKDIIEVWDITEGKQIIERRIKIKDVLLKRNRGIAETQEGYCENDKESNTKRDIQKREKDISKDISIDSKEPIKFNASNIDRKITKIVPKDKPLDPPKDKSPAKSKYTHSVADLRNYNECIQSGATKHHVDCKAEKETLDKLHALFAGNCKDPYHSIYIPHQYGDFKWDMDTLIEVFKYHLSNSKSPTKSIGDFIFYQGFSKSGKKMVKDDSKSWSPLLFWHQKMTKTANGELTEEGKDLLSSMKRSKIDGLTELDFTIINKVAKDLSAVADKYTFMDDSKRSMTYPFGIVDCLSKHIKQKTNNFDFKLVYITKNGFVSEFIDSAQSRNIIKKRKR